MRNLISRKSCLAILLLTCIHSTALLANTLVLKDGSRIHGTIITMDIENNEVTLKNKAGRIYKFKSEEIEQYITDESSSSNTDFVSIKSQKEKSDEETHHQYGLTLTISSVIYYLYRESGKSDNDVKAELDGLDISAIYYFNNNFGIEGAFYWGNTDKVTIGKSEYDLSTFTEFESLSTIGARSALIGGWNIRDKGFRIYGGLGLYAERTTENRTNQSTINDIILGSALKFGLGYSWSSVSLDFWGSIRSNQAYGFSGGSAQGGLALSYRFH